MNYCRLFKLRKDSTDMFKKYFIFVLGLSIVIVNFFLLCNYTLELSSGVLKIILITTSVIAFAVDIILIIYTMILMMRVSKCLGCTEDVNKYKREQKWFFILLKIGTVMLITWTIQYYTMTQHFDAYISITSDVTKLFSAIVLFNMFILRDEAREIILRKSRAAKTNCDF